MSACVRSSADGMVVVTGCGCQYGPYSASMAAVEQMTKVFAKEVGGRGITANSVSPGPTETPLSIAEKTEAQIAHLSSMAALGRLGQPEDIANVVAMLCSPDGSWVTGQNIGANGGFAQEDNLQSH